MYRTLILIVFFLVPICLLGQNERGTPVANVSMSVTSQSNIYGIVVGISDYAELKDLEFADRDAAIFAQYLEKDMGVPHKNIKLFVNEEATKFNIVDELYHLNELVKPNDIVYFYFAGHGDIEAKIAKENALLLLYKSLRVNYLKGNDYISLLELRQWLDNLSEKQIRIIFIADACHSGGLIGGKEGQEKTASALVSEWKNQTKIVSCQPDERSLESKEWGGGRGVFSFHFIEGMQGLADMDKDSIVTLIELQNYVQTQVRKQASPVKQTPIFQGNLDQTLSKSNPKSLMLIKEHKTKDYPAFSTINSKSLEAELLESVDSLTFKYYQLFSKSLKNKAYSQPENDCAYYYLTQIKPSTQNTDLLRVLKRNFAATLQEKAMVIINKMLNNNENFENISQYEYLLASKELQLAQALLGNNHYLYTNIEARIFFLKVCSNIHNLKGTLYIDKAEEKLIKENISLLQKSIKLEPNVPYSYQFLLLLYSIQGNLSELEQCLLDYLSIFRNDPIVFAVLGVYYLEKKDYANAEVNLKKSIELNPKLYSSYTQLGYMYHSLNKNNEALISVKTAIELNPYDVDSYSLLTKIYSENEQKNKALEISNKFDQLMPQDVSNCHKLGALYLAKSNYNKAISYFTKCLEIDSKNAEANFYLGLTYSRLKQYDSAIEYYKKSIILKPNDNITYIELAKVFKEINQFENAIKCYEKVISLDSTLLSSDDFLSLGKLYGKIDQYEKALKCLQLTIFLNPDEPQAYFFLGTVYFELKQYNKAEENLKKAIYADPRDVSSYYNLGNTYYNLKQFDKAIEQYKKTISINPKFVSSYYNLGSTYYYLKQFDNAIEQFQKVILIDPKDASAYNKLGMIYRAEFKDFSAAEENYSKGLIQNPKNKDLLTGLAYSQTSQKKYQDAEKTFRKALEVDNADHWAYYNLCCLFSIQSKPTEAFSWLNQALQKGFKDYEHIQTDTDLDNIRQLPEFKTLMEKYFPQKK